MNFNDIYNMMDYYCNKANEYDNEYEVSGREDDYVRYRQMECLARFCERVLKEMSE